MKANAWSRFGTMNQTASAGAAPVAAFTATVVTASATTSSQRQRVPRWTTNQTARMPAAGHTRLRFVLSITVSRPAYVAMTYSRAKPAVRAADRETVMHLLSALAGLMLKALSGVEDPRHDHPDLDRGARRPTGAGGVLRNADTGE